MSHTNTGSNSHKNTGYNNHTNYSNYNQSGYNNHKNTGGYTQSGYNNHANYGNHTNYNNYLCYTQSGGYTQSGYNNHTNYSNYNQSGYNNHKNTGGYAQSGSNTHSNTGYSNHIDKNLNVIPENISKLDKNILFYYKDNIILSWPVIANMGKPISATGVTFGEDYSLCGITENNTYLIKGGMRGISVQYWNSSGIKQSGRTFDTYVDTTANGTNITNFTNFINNIPANSYIAIYTADNFARSATTFPPIKAILNSLGFGNNSINKISTDSPSRSAFVGIVKKGGSVLAEQATNYTIPAGGTSSAPVATGVVSVSAVLPVNSGQTITYTIQAAYKEINGNYGAWETVGTTTTTTFTYNLSKYSTGFIKFRIIASDGIESSAAYTEIASECRILKYTAPADWASTSSGTILYANDWNYYINQVNTFLKLYDNTNLGIENTSVGSIPNKNDVNTIVNKLNTTTSTLGKTNIDLQINSENEFKASDFNILKNWLKSI